jgi:hypothetical protein
VTSETEGRSRRSAWIPPLLVGVATGVAAEVSTAVLLYGGPGFTRSLTTTLGIQALAFGAGLRAHGPRPGAGLRRRWLLALTAYVAATAFATLWMVFPAVGNDRRGQGLGLAALAALPLYACGALLAGLSLEASRRRADRASAHGRGPAVASTASFGAALGFVATGLLLPRAPMPASLLVACLVLLSLGAMIDASGAGESDGSGGQPSLESALDDAGPGDAEPVGPTAPPHLEGVIPADATRPGEDPPTS